MSSLAINPSEIVRSVGAGLALAAMLLILPRCVLAAPSTAVATNDFLDSIPDRGQPLAKTIEMVRYCGFRWVRAGKERMREKGPTTQV
jgi:hypothetical protein